MTIKLLENQKIIADTISVPLSKKNWNCLSISCRICQLQISKRLILIKN